jgi:hypothetical protein
MKKLTVVGRHRQCFRVTALGTSHPRYGDDFHAALSLLTVVLSRQRLLADTKRPSELGPSINEGPSSERACIRLPSVRRIAHERLNHSIGHA